MRIVDAHVHCGTMDTEINNLSQVYEDIAPHFDEAGVNAAVCFSPVMEIYDRHTPDFQDNDFWRARRKQSREYLLGLKGRDLPHTIYPFYFVWNDFDADGIDGYCGIKWHRHVNEPIYHYDDPACARMIDAIRERDYVVLIEEGYEETMRFVDELAEGIPIIIPHLGYLNGSFDRLFAEDFWNRPNTYADLSGGSAIKAPENPRKFLDRYGPERLLFGSDYPCAMPIQHVQMLDGLNLPDADRELICNGNIMRLLRNAS